MYSIWEGVETDIADQRMFSISIMIQSQLLVIESDVDKKKSFSCNGVKGSCGDVLLS